MVLLSFICNLCRIFEIPLINCEVIDALNWYTQYIISSNTIEVEATSFVLTDTKLKILCPSCNSIISRKFYAIANTSIYVLVVTLLIKDITKLFEQSKSTFGRTTKN